MKRSRPRGLVPTHVVLALAVGFGACAEGPPEFPSLATGFEPDFDVELNQVWTRGVAGDYPLRLQPSNDAAGFWVEAALTEDHWRSQARGSGIWIAPRLMPGEGRPSDGGPSYALRSGEVSYELTSLEAALSEPELLTSHSFSVAGDSVYAYTGPNGASPGACILREYVSLGEVENGRWRMKIGRYSGDALPVLPSFHIELPHVLVPNEVLRFATVGRSYSRQDRKGTLMFRVSCDADLVFEHAQRVGLEARPEYHTVSFPKEMKGEVILRFEVRGDAALSGFFHPVFGPEDVGRYGDRPWKEKRRDVVVFLADTFRADNLEAWGGDARIAPSLNAFARRSLVFPRAFASSTWTLPSHAALFSGLQPYQCGATTDLSTLAEEAETVAERFRAAGYRTGAVTDHAFVSSTYGLDQGFDAFDEAWLDLEDTLNSAKRFLDGDDGRPVFLFVHTYRTHVPYHASPQARSALQGLHDIRRTYEQLTAAAAAIEAEFGDAWAEAPSFAAYRDDSEALYRGGAHDLDAGFERFRVDLEGRGLLQDGRLIFTSDHGEGFWEHGSGGHGEGLFDEHLRIPLLIHGGDLGVGTRSLAATHVDLAPTLLRLAGLTPASSWVGVDLLDEDEDRPAFSHECPHGGGPTGLAILDGAHKVVTERVAMDGTGTARARFAFDLANDPREGADVLEGGAPWPAQLLGGLEDELERLFRREFEGGDVDLSPEERDRLRALGYFGD